MTRILKFLGIAHAY